MRSLFSMGLAVVVVSALGVAAASRADDGPKSGLAVGEPAPAFDVYDVTGPNQGTELCYR
ncbi:hypothetical protein BH23PLA1_BH23PLA1_22340 [soil metagenome]